MKPPLSGKEIGYHTDGAYIPWDLATIWIALDDVTAHSGTLGKRYLPLDGEMDWMDEWIVIISYYILSYIISYLILYNRVRKGIS